MWGGLLVSSAELDKDQGRNAIISDRHLGTLSMNRTVTLLPPPPPFLFVRSFFFCWFAWLSFASTFSVTDHPTKRLFRIFHHHPLSSTFTRPQPLVHFSAVIFFIFIHFDMECRHKSDAWEARTLFLGSVNLMKSDGGDAGTDG